MQKIKTNESTTIMVNKKVHAILKTYALGKDGNIKDVIEEITKENVARDKKIKEFEKEHGYELVHGIFMDDESKAMDPAAIGKSMIKSWIFEAAALLNLNPSEIQIKGVGIHD